MSGKVVLNRPKHLNQFLTTCCGHEEQSPSMVFFCQCPPPLFEQRTQQLKPHACASGSARQPAIPPQSAWVSSRQRNAVRGGARAWSGSCHVHYSPSRSSSRGGDDQNIHTPRHQPLSTARQQQHGHWQDKKEIANLIRLAKETKARCWLPFLRRRSALPLRASPLGTKVPHYFGALEPPALDSKHTAQALARGFRPRKTHENCRDTL